MSCPPRNQPCEAMLCLRSGRRRRKKYPPVLRIAPNTKELRSNFQGLAAMTCPWLTWQATSLNAHFHPVSPSLCEEVPPPRLMVVRSPQTTFDKAGNLFLRPPRFLLSTSCSHGDQALGSITCAREEGLHGALRLAFRYGRYLASTPSSRC